MPRLPPHEKDSIYIAFRCSLLPTDPEYHNFFVSMFSDFICAYETGEKNETPHFHCIFNKKGLRCERFKEMVKQKFALEGNAHFSAVNVAPTETDYKQALEYVCKYSKTDRITPPVILWASSNYTQEIILSSHDAYHVRHNTSYPQTLQQGPQQVLKTVKIKPRTWTEKFQEYLDTSDHLQEIDWDWYNDEHVRLMTRLVIENLGQTSKKISPRIINELVMGFLNHVNATGFREDMEIQVSDDILNLRGPKGRGK